MSAFDTIQATAMSRNAGQDRSRWAALPPGMGGLTRENSLHGMARDMMGGMGPGVDLGPVAMSADAYVFLLQDTIMRLREAEARIARQQERIDHLETLSVTDELTGLLNRRGFMDAFRRELAAGRRSGVGGVLVMIDLDGFKSINDSHGHQCGDWYLRQVGQVLKDMVRAHDIVARLGGDEFAVLLTGTDRAQGFARAETLAAEFNAQSCQWQMTSLPLRGSFGAEAFAATDQEEEVMRRADMGMYRAKRAGKAARR
ncbi:GGDEF domain-containing protein [Niveispirillum fermenti]|uniref:GGDEF domain-containing protein n=1 Tax=Niveispirillum fermenti TaxID=1233113 RepID=UPI003A86F8AB